MSKPTHRIRVKELYDFISSTQESSISFYKLDFIKNNSKINIDAYKSSNDIYRVLISGITLYFYYNEIADIQPIEPEIAIPEGDFWIRKGGVYKVTSNGYSGYFLYNEQGSKVAGKVEKYTVKEFLKNGTWTICDAPEKKTRPFTDEEWREWFLEDGVFENNQGGSFFKVLSYFNEVFEFVNIFGKIDNLSKAELLKHNLDRHGNPFTKAVD